MSAIILGTTLKVSFGSFAYTGYVAESVSDSYDDNNLETIKDANGATMTKIFMDPVRKLDCELVILGASGSITAPAKGATLGLIPPQGTLTSFMVESAKVSFKDGAT